MANSKNHPKTIDKLKTSLSDEDVRELVDDTNGTKKVVVKNCEIYTALAYFRSLSSTYQSAKIRTIPFRVHCSTMTSCIVFCVKVLLLQAEFSEANKQAWTTLYLRLQLKACTGTTDLNDDLDAQHRHKTMAITRGEFAGGQYLSDAVFKQWGQTWRATYQTCCPRHVLNRSG